MAEVSASQNCAQALPTVSGGTAEELEAFVLLRIPSLAAKREPCPEPITNQARASTSHPVLFRVGTNEYSAP